MEDDYSPLVVAAPQTIERNDPIRGLVNEWHYHLRKLIKASELSEATYKTYTRSLDKFLAWCFAQQVTQVSNETILDWKASIGGKPATINIHVAGLRAFFSWAYGFKRLAHNPMEGVKNAKQKGSRRHKRDVLTPYEINLILSKVHRDKPSGKRDYAILALFAYTALRSIEVYRADIENLHTVGDKLVLDVHGKGHIEDDDVVVLANPVVREAVYEWLGVRGGTSGALFTSMSNRSEGERLSLRAIRDIVKGYYAAAGIHEPKKTTHSLRHSAITNAIKNGAPIQKVQRMARHTSIDTTMIYFHEADRLEDPAEGYINYD